MNIALTKIYAAASANLCGRYSLVRGAGWGCALALAGLSAAHAGPGEKEARQVPPAAPVQAAPAPAARVQAPVQRQAEPMRNEVRQFDQRAVELRADEQRRAVQLQQDQGAHSVDAARRTGRLTPDEKRDLRRQINEAGIDLYQNTPRR